MTKLLLLDKNGTIVRSKSGSKFVQNPEDQELIPGAIKTIDWYASHGWDIAIVSNQGGVIAGHKTLEQARDEMVYCLELVNLMDEQTLCDSPPRPIQCAYFCPDSGESCQYVSGNYGRTVGTIYRRFTIPENLFGIRSYRKPGAGMLHQAIKDTQIWGPVTHVLMVGDRPEDKDAALAAAVPFLWAEDWRAAGMAYAALSVIEHRKLMTE